MKPPLKPSPIRLRLMLLVGMATVAVGSPGHTAGEPAAFIPPDGPVLVSRTLVRSLPGGKEVHTMRSYRVRFKADGDGFRIDGELAEVKVEAPPILAGLAAIERERTDPGLFPLRLDRSGRILHSSLQARDDVRAEATAQAQAMLNEAALDPAARSRAQIMLQQVSTAASGQTAWPTDLFNPAAPTTHERRPFALATGERGSIEIVVRTDGRKPGHLPGSVERLVETELAGSRRSSREIWAFQPIE